MICDKIILLLLPSEFSRLFTHKGTFDADFPPHKQILQTLSPSDPCSVFPLDRTAQEDHFHCVDPERLNTRRIW